MMPDEDFLLRVSRRYGVWLVTGADEREARIGRAWA
jgi:hypothetical protein